jgi:hypothetical protein
MPSGAVFVQKSQILAILAIIACTEVRRSGNFGQSIYQLTHLPNSSKIRN